MSNDRQRDSGLLAPQADRLAAQLCESGDVPGLAIEVMRDGQTSGTRGWGRAGLESDAGPIDERTIFLVASLTKPVVAMGALRLVEEGLLALNDRVTSFVPEFSAAEKRGITIRHLLTHSSGLPDMLPNNRQLRMSNSGLSAFVEGACAVSLDFAPGRGVQYQSMGFAVLGEIIARVCGLSCADFLDREVFQPLEMQDTALGAPADWYESQADQPPKIERVARIRVPEEQEGGDEWNWNSRYWQMLGAPWGGMLSTPRDLGIFCRMMLRGGEYAGRQIFSPATVGVATGNQLLCLPSLPEADRRTRAWGFGWRLNWTAHDACFCDLLSPGAYGHWGATGTLFWIDPVLNGAAVILSTQPLARGRSHLTRLSNAIVAGW